MDIILLLIICILGYFLFKNKINLNKKNNSAYGSYSLIQKKQCDHTFNQPEIMQESENALRIDCVENQTDDTFEETKENWREIFWSLSDINKEVFTTKPFLNEEKKHLFWRLIKEYSGSKHSVFCNVNISSFINTYHYYNVKNNNEDKAKQLYGIVHRLRADFVIISNVNQRVIAVIQLNKYPEGDCEQSKSDKMIAEVLKQVNIPFQQLKDKDEEFSWIIKKDDKSKK